MAKSRTFSVHSDLLTAESERFTNSLPGGFKEAKDRTLDIEDEDPELFGFLVEYIYRNQSILSKEIEHYSDYITLARLYAMGERLMAPNFQSICLWRFTRSLDTRTSISDEGVCELLQVACTEITERTREDAFGTAGTGSHICSSLALSVSFSTIYRTLVDTCAVG